MVMPIPGIPKTRPLQDHELPLAVVRLDDASIVGGPATVLEVLPHFDTRRAFDKYRDRDGCIPDDLRLWRVGPWTGPGARVSLGGGSSR